MNCRTFHKNFEDYLEDGLDFSGRFGMERHAQQCIRCGKELADAQRLRQMVLELPRVKAPENFESSVLNRIGMRRAHGWFSGIRSFWAYGIEWPSWQKLVLASSSVAILGFGVFYALRQTIPDITPAPSLIATDPAKKIDNPAKIVDAKNERDVNTVRSHSRPQSAGKVLKTAKTTRPPSPPEEALSGDREAAEGEYVYVEYTVLGPDNRPVPIRLPMPKQIRMQYGQASEEYFIQNVSH